MSDVHLHGGGFIERDRRDDDVRHGTASGALRHSLAGEDPCDACRAAKAAYDADWRGAPERTRLNRLFAKAQRLALRDLKRAHEEEYRALYVNHRDAVLLAYHEEQEAEQT